MGVCGNDLAQIDILDDQQILTGKMKESGVKIRQLLELTKNCE